MLAFSNSGALSHKEPTAAREAPRDDREEDFADEIDQLDADVPLEDSADEDEGTGGYSVFA